MATPDHTPVGRGYDSSLHYFHHENDYWVRIPLRGWVSPTIRSARHIGSAVKHTRTPITRITQHTHTQHRHYPPSSSLPSSHSPPRTRRITLSSNSCVSMRPD